MQHDCMNKFSKIIVCSFDLPKAYIINLQSRAWEFDRQNHFWGKISEERVLGRYVLKIGVPDSN